MDKPWLLEPDRIEFQHAGFPCLVLRHRHGHLCGYVAIPPGHPWHGKAYDEIDADVHGGLTYADACNGVVCHAPKPGEPDDVWWLGFDAAHFGDLQPFLAERLAALPEPLRYDFSDCDTYRTVTYMRGECERLAEQAKETRP
jgi:hypothetical protein